MVRWRAVPIQRAHRIWIVRYGRTMAVIVRQWRGRVIIRRSRMRIRLMRIGHDYLGEEEYPSSNRNTEPEVSRA